MEPRITIGLPVFNGEKTLRQSIESVISQTFEEFILIVSDNGSTDSTPLVCKEYQKHDKRIQYIRQKQNIGPINNFLFLLDKAKSDYFVWIAADDFWVPTFLEKSIRILDSRKDTIASTGQTDIVGEYFHKFDYNNKDNFIIKFYKKIRRNFLSVKCNSICGDTYMDRLRMCFKSFRYGVCVYGLFRTSVLKKSINFTMHPWDWVLILMTLKYGNINVFDEVQIYRNPGGLSNRNIIDAYIHKDVKFFQMLFPRIPFTKWCIRNLGKRVFFQNIAYFIKLNYSGPTIILLDFIKYFKSRNDGKMYQSENDLTIT